ncbi:EamA-like transporter family protein [Clostridium cavendishii DSM 21758]|uniref:EamA-like transporter family protein n=1 Tax=Clostridium cavendishii DSM 21758 TaxID=1121302 RepID=A0A1M6MQJ4_9CLOT|nr:DMT family transporter [Clostridium cavendishii]SHJ85714.1 EamA-like transporter family protein [Clostridium cavendishii DSM 21758]
MNNKKKGILLIIISAFGFAVMGVFVKLAGDIPAVEKSFFRNIVSLLVAFYLILKNKGSLWGKKENRNALFWRSALGTLGIVGNYYSIDKLLISDAAMLNKLSPFFVIIFSYLFLKEEIKPIHLVALFTAFLGSFFIIKPSFNSELFPALIGFSSAAFAGGAYTIVRYLGNREKGYTIIFFFSLFSIISTLPFVIFSFKSFSLIEFAYMMGAGAFASLSQFALTEAYRFAPSTEISIYDYSQIIFTAILGFILWGALPDYLSIIGYVLILVASLGIFIKNNEKKVKTGKSI